MVQVWCLEMPVLWLHIFFDCFEIGFYFCEATLVYFTGLELRFLFVSIRSANFWPHGRSQQRFDHRIRLRLFSAHKGKRGFASHNTVQPTLGTRTRSRLKPRRVHTETPKHRESLFGQTMDFFVVDCYHERTVPAPQFFRVERVRYHNKNLWKKYT